MKSIKKIPKSLKIISLVITVIIVLLALVFLGIKLFGNKESEVENSYSRKVRQILNLYTEPASDEDEEYLPEKENNGQYKISVNKKNNVIVVYKKDSKGEYSEAFKSMTCSVGRDVSVGEYETGDRYLWKIVNGNVWAQYATRLDGATMFQSVPFREKAKNTLIVKYYNQLGTNCNASAIRLSVADAKWIMENSPEGTIVEVFEDDDMGPLGKPNVLALSEDDCWDPSDPDPSNPGNGNGIIFVGVTDKTVERGISIDYLEGVQVVNRDGVELSVNIEVDSDVDIFKCGTYEVIYSVRDASGAVTEENAVYKVVDTMKPVFSGVPTKISLKDTQKPDEEQLKKGIFVIDNNQFLSSDKIKITVPDNLEDGKTIVFSVTDDYGNESRIEVACVIDTTPPEIVLKSGVKNIIDITETVDESFALSRVVATDSGVELSKENVSVDISTNEWGYTFNYTAKDDGGLTATLQNTVTYPVYEFVLPEEEFVDDLSDISLLKNVILKDNLERSITLDKVKVTSALSSGDKYLVKYEYEYTSPLGAKTATAERTVTLNVVEEPVENEDDETDEVVDTTEEPENNIYQSEE